MPDRSDSDSSPKSTSSAGSRSSGEEVKPIRDAGSPRHGQQSSDDSVSSDGVLVELPGQPDQVLALDPFVFCLFLGVNVEIFGRLGSLCRVVGC